MKKLILLSAHFKVCDCGQHGKVVFPNGKESDDVLSKADAMTLIDKLRKGKRVSREEVLALKEQVNGSSLPDQFQVRKRALLNLLAQVATHQLVHDKSQGIRWIGNHSQN